MCCRRARPRSVAEGPYLEGTSKLWKPGTERIGASSLSSASSMGGDEQRNAQHVSRSDGKGGKAASITVEPEDEGRLDDVLRVGSRDRRRVLGPSVQDGHHDLASYVGRPDGRQRLARVRERVGADLRWDELARLEQRRRGPRAIPSSPGPGRSSPRPHALRAPRRRRPRPPTPRGPRTGPARPARPVAPRRRACPPPRRCRRRSGKRSASATSPAE